jgi:hypothetical protein
MHRFSNRSTARRLLTVLLLGFSAMQADRAVAQRSTVAEPDWSLNATVMETCSCPTFCQCYFHSYPAAHMGPGGHGTVERFCRFNRALRINRGNFGKTQLESVKFWMAGDLGADFSKEHYDWTVLVFEPSLTKERRDALVAIAHHVFPGTWNSFTIGKDATLEWKQTNDRAEAKLGGGKTAEIALHHAEGMTTDPVIIKNLKYEGAPRNDGFILMPNEIEAYHVGPKAFEFKGTNGFVTTIDMSSKDLKK